MRSQDESREPLFALKAIQSSPSSNQLLANKINLLKAQKDVHAAEGHNNGKKNQTKQERPKQPHRIQATTSNREERGNLVAGHGRDNPTSTLSNRECSRPI
ncbi:uncharacterized protein LOC131298158 [Rhododendron vialii]|uniref:uncharacterized protein LOC131298158 n=1 Tax=Rhododendron vialii TaxID=182163 RepID=UPI00265DB731|nr:uncharacterized protein LOC131298158 [Rhododendron vialii]